MNWQEVRIKTVQDAVETISNLFHELGVGGVVIEDPALIQHHIDENTWDHYEFSQEDDLEGKVVVKAYLPVNENLPNKMEEIKSELDYIKLTYFPDAFFEIFLAQVAEEDWANSWKAYYKPEKIGERVVIKPSWEEYEAKAEELIIELDPGMAFGTGNHATTSMCIRALERYISGNEKVYDVGTGSGVLATTAALLGAKKVLAVDIDEVAVKVASENVRINQVQNQVEVLQGNLLDLIKEPRDIIVANIIADIIIKVCLDVPKLLKATGYFIASGIIQERKEEVIEALEKANLRVVETIEEGEWVALIASHSNGGTL